MRTRLRHAAAVVVTTAALGALGAGAAALAQSATATTATLAQLVERWPTSYAVTGTKAEPLYTERISLVRDGDSFSLTIEVIGQGDAAFATQRSDIHVTSDGTIVWDAGCPDAARCADDAQLRGYLASATLVALARQQALPEHATARTLYGTEVLCVDDAALHPDAEPAAVELETCFDPTTGAAVAQWSPPSDAFTGATLADGFAFTIPAPTTES